MQVIHFNRKRSLRLDLFSKFEKLNNSKIRDLNK